MQIIDGKALAKRTRENLKIEVDALKDKGIIPKLAVILVGEDPASQIYVRNKSKACNEVGIEFEEILLSEETTMKELLSIIDNLNERKDITGILLQSPIPKHLDINEAFRRIAPEKDVDGFNPVNVRKTMFKSRYVCILYTLWNNENARGLWYQSKRQTCSDSWKKQYSWKTYVTMFT